MTIKILDRSGIQNVLANAHGRFVRVSFIKKDGTLTSKVLQPASGKFHRVAKPTPAGAQATRTRRENNPTLVNHRTARGNWVSFDLRKVLQVQSAGTTYIIG